jgi:hypothetical protein
MNASQRIDLGLKSGVRFNTTSFGSSKINLCIELPQIFPGLTVQQSRDFSLPKSYAFLITGPLTGRTETEEALRFLSSHICKL